MTRPTCSLLTPLTIVMTGTIVVDAVDDRDDGDDVDAGLVQVFNRAELDVEQVANAAMRIGGIADAVELQVRVTQSGFSRGLRELRTLGELDAVGCRLNAVVANLARVADRVQEVRRHRRLAARELHGHLPARLDGDRVVEHLLDVFPRELMDEPDLVRVHEAGVAHHVAAIGEIDGEDRAASVLDGGAAVVVQLLVVVRADVAPRKHFLEMLEERRIHRHHVLEVAVDGTVLDHQDLAVALDDRRLDFADFLVEEDGDVLLPVENLLARLARAGGAQRVGLAGPAERRLGLLIGLEQRFVRPPRREGGILPDLVGSGKHLPDSVGGNR